ncbi:nuclear transport factor 2 family protein [Rudaeicoccus suwonensis]|uniref:Limonene-1,2-epoxide hydrolase n=1 Tax=Rudaeicoccus suwonensis TaxID=657409 RepID=A0A561DWW9_9MICO|nr:limonene-1,2-epoxide hydrolase family protein [Rudaeicoccus suwonensis]TWE07871.1 limonene-1,2-epoxide hydrolase [Rudaeicoccus suwonensis]
MAIEDDVLAVAHDMIDAWNRLDWERVLALFAEDGLLHSMMEDDATVGRPAIRRRLQALTEGTSEIRIEIRNEAAVGNLVFLERVDNFVIGGRSGSMPVVGVLEIEDGVVAAWREYYDRATLLRGLGVDHDFAEDL